MKPNVEMMFEEYKIAKAIFDAISIAYGTTSGSHGYLWKVKMELK